MSDETTPNFCSHCGKLIKDKQNKFCSNCGHELKTVKEEATGKETLITIIFKILYKFKILTIQYSSYFNIFFLFHFSYLF